jgi:hypothetical protein
MDAMPSAPVPATKITEQYAALVARDAYFWAGRSYSRILVTAVGVQAAALG